MIYELHIRNLNLNDLESITAIHKAAFSKSVITVLGNGAIRRYYDWQLTGPHEVVALGAFADANLCAFCLGGVFHGSLSGFLKRNRTFLCWRLFIRPWLITIPEVRRRFLQAARILNPVSKSGGGSSVPKRRSKRSFGILSIAVHPDYQGSSIGKTLLREMETCANQLGFTQMHLTVNPTNKKAMSFYERSGWARPDKEEPWNGFLKKKIK